MKSLKIMPMPCMEDTYLFVLQAWCTCSRARHFNNRSMCWLHMWMDALFKNMINDNKTDLLLFLILVLINKFPNFSVCPLYIFIYYYYYIMLNLPFYICVQSSQNHLLGSSSTQTRRHLQLSSLPGKPGYAGGLKQTFTLEYCPNNMQVDKEGCDVVTTITGASYTCVGLNSFTWYRMTLWAVNIAGNSSAVETVASTTRKFLNNEKFKKCFPFEL